MSDDRTREGLEHLQAAALELIAAGRAFLDVAEELVKEPATAAVVVRAAGTMARAAQQAAQPSRPGAAADANDSPPPPGEERVTRIRLS
jgi:hypothetical protein